MREFRPFSELALEDHDLVTKCCDVGLVCSILLGDETDSRKGCSEARALLADRYTIRFTIKIEPRGSDSS